MPSKFGFEDCADCQHAADRQMKTWEKRDHWGVLSRAKPPSDTKCSHCLSGSVGTAVPGPAAPLAVALRHGRKPRSQVGRHCPLSR